MKACVLHAPGPLESAPLVFEDAAAPSPGADEVLIRVSVCGVCRTDLHVVEGELPPRRAAVIPGHQAVGRVVQRGSACQRLKIGARVGVPWLHRTCGRCEFCGTGRENLCEEALFTGYTADGGYAEFVVAPENFVYPIPDGFADLDAAPLLCAGIIGFRCLRVAQAGRGSVLGMYGFGAAAHVAIQVARHWGARVFAFTRDPRHQEHARQLGAEWAGTIAETPPAPLDAAVIFAPAGELVPAALARTKRGGAVVLGGIYSSPIPAMEFSLLYPERSIRSVANNTRADGEDFLRVAAEIPIRAEVQLYPLAEANRALLEHKRGTVRGAAVLQIE